MKKLLTSLLITMTLLGCGTDGKDGINGTNGDTGAAGKDGAKGDTGATGKDGTDNRIVKNTSCSIEVDFYGMRYLVYEIDTLSSGDVFVRLKSYQHAGGASVMYSGKAAGAASGYIATFMPTGYNTVIYNPESKTVTVTIDNSWLDVSETYENVGTCNDNYYD